MIECRCAQTLDLASHDSASDDDFKVIGIKPGAPLALALTPAAQSTSTTVFKFRSSSPRPHKLTSPRDSQQLTHTTVNVPGRGHFDIPLFQRSERKPGSTNVTLETPRASSQDTLPGAGAMSPPRRLERNTANTDGIVVCLDL